MCPSDRRGSGRRRMVGVLAASLSLVVLSACGDDGESATTDVDIARGQCEPVSNALDALDSALAGDQLPAEVPEALATVQREIDADPRVETITLAINSLLGIPAEQQAAAIVTLRDAGGYQTAVDQLQVEVAEDCT